MIAALQRLFKSKAEEHEQLILQNMVSTPIQVNWDEFYKIFTEILQKPEISSESQPTETEEEKLKLIELPHNLDLTTHNLEGQGGLQMGFLTY